MSEYEKDDQKNARGHAVAGESKEHKNVTGITSISEANGGGNGAALASNSTVQLAQAAQYGPQYPSNGVPNKTAPAPAQAELWGSIPQELRERPQWCIAGTDKRPLTADGAPASSTNPATWGDFESICEAAKKRGQGIGFVLTAEDEFTCIDIDVKDDTPQQHLDRFHKIIEAFDSYTERSRSGKGWHVWCKGGHGAGVRRDGVEVYSQERFIICTGNAAHVAKPINERGDLVATLVTEICKKQGVTYGKAQLEEVPEDYTDAEIWERASSADNGEKFRDLCAGNWQNYIEYPSQSEADLSLISMLAFYSRSNAQCRRMFRMTKLGEREKATKNDVYVNRTLQVIRGRQANDSEDRERARQNAENLLKKLDRLEESVMVNVKLEAKKGDDDHNRLVIPASCRGHLLIEMGFEMGRVTEMPEVSCVLIGLGAFSGIASAAYCTAYRDGSRLPLGLYTVAEQPPGTGKSHLINKFVKPWLKHVADINNARPVPDDEGPINQLLYPLSDTTPEGLENNMQKADSGHFFLQSAEQGAIKQLFGDKLNGRSKNFDVPLKGFNGEFHASARVTRQGISREVFGAITVFAQGGSIRTILNNTDGEGLAERFLYASEPSNLGRRKHDEHILPAEVERKYRHALQGVADACKSLEKLGDIDALKCLFFTPQGHQQIKQMQIRFEPKQARYNDQGVAGMNSILAKADMQVMKLATLLHVAHYLGFGAVPSPVVPESCVTAAIELVEVLIGHIELVMIGEEEAGADLGHDAIRRWLSSRPNGANLRLIQDALKRTKPFKSMQRPRPAISQAISEMVATGDIKQVGQRFTLP